MTPTNQMGKRTEILNTSVGTSTQEHIIHLGAQQLLSSLKLHIVQGLLKASFGRFSLLGISRNMLSNTDAHTWVGTISNTGLDISSIKCQLLVEHSIVAALQRFPIGHSLVPRLALGCILPTLQVIKRGTVGGDKTATRTHLNREVAQRQSALHTHSFYCRSGILDKIARSTTGGYLCHQVKGHILRCYTLT